MDHILARIRGVKMEDIKNVLKADALKHAEQGLVLRHVWRNADDPDEILFAQGNLLKWCIHKPVKKILMPICPKCCF
jgi:hypothetical protein